MKQVTVIQVKLKQDKRR